MTPLMATPIGAAVVAATGAIGLAAYGVEVLSGATNIGTAIDGKTLTGKELTTSERLSRGISGTVAVTTGIMGGVASYNSVQSGIKVGKALNIIKNSSFSTNKNSAIFYSGEGQKEIAEQEAINNGKQLIGDTEGGKLLNDLLDNSNLSKNITDRIWGLVSKKYADSASDVVYAFTKGADPTRIWAIIELSTLMKNSNVTNIITELLK